MKKNDLSREAGFVMSLVLAGNNVIISARQFNPSVFSQLWLVKNDLVQEGDFDPKCVFSEALVQAVSPKFMLLVVPEQLQFVPLGDEESNQTVIEEKLGRIVDRLPHTPYTAMGFNFVWHLALSEEDVGRLGRELFFKSDSELFRRFDTEDARFGAYLSKDSLGARLKLDIKPVVIVNPLKPLERYDMIQFAFNYHLDLLNLADAVTLIHGLLGRWDEARAESLQIIHSLQPRR